MTKRYPIVLVILGTLGCLFAFGNDWWQRRRILALNERQLSVELTSASLDRLLAEVTPLVEAAAGRPFLSPVQARVVEPAELAAALSADAALLAEERAGGAPDAVEWLSLLGHFDAIASTMLGKYSLGNKEVLIIPRNFVGAFASHGHSVPVDVENVVRLVLAHELTHGLQHQYLGINDASSWVSSGLNADVAVALIEGHAVVIQDEVARLLDIASAEEMLLQVTTEPPIGQSAASGAAIERRRHAYKIGFETLWPIHVHSGAARVWQILSNPEKEPKLLDSLHHDLQAAR